MPYEHDLRIIPHRMKCALATYFQTPLLQQPLDFSGCEQGEIIINSSFSLKEKQDNRYDQN
jgi:hypothetical protein